MAIPLTTITIPTPAPYDNKNPEMQRENFYYVWLQILQAAKYAGESVSLNPSTALTVDLSQLVAAVQALAFNNQEIDLGDLTIRFRGRVLSIEEV